MRRFVKLFGGVDQDSVVEVINKLIALDEESDELIYFYIYSPGGDVNAMLNLAKIMDTLRSPVATIVLGMAASAGAFTLLSGTRGKRYAMAESRIMLHQHRGYAYVTGNTETKNDKLSDLINTHIAERCGDETKDAAYWETILDRDLWLDAEAAKAEGIVDEVYYAEGF